MGLRRQEAGEAPQAGRGLGGGRRASGPHPPLASPHPAPLPTHTLAGKFPSPGRAPRQLGTVPGSPPSAGSRVGQAAAAPRTWPGTPGASRTRGPEAGAQKVRVPRVGRRVADRRAAGGAACPEQAWGGRKGGGRRTRPQSSAVPGIAAACPAGLPPALPAQLRGEAARARGRPVAADRAVAALAGGRPSEAGPRAVKEKNIPRPANCCSQLFFFFFFLLLLERKKKKKKAALPLEADAKRMQNFNHLLHRPSPAGWPRPCTVAPREGEWRELQMPLSGRCWKSSQASSPPVQKLGPTQGCEDWRAWVPRASTELARGGRWAP